MAEIQSPASYLDDVATVGEYLEVVTEWHQAHAITEQRFLSGVWLRGNGRCYSVPLRPGVYRDDFSQRAQLTYGVDVEEKRLNLERQMLYEFRTSGSVFLNADKIIDVYFIAQHYGMPTRLLDWTTNPLAALFFAVENTELHGVDGEVFIMEAKRILPDVPIGATGNAFLFDVVGMRHPYVTDAIGVCFWHTPSTTRPPLIIPLRPDNQVELVNRVRALRCICTGQTLAQIQRWQK